MGAFSFILYSTKNPTINIEYTKAFLEMKNRGTEEQTMYITKHSTDINEINNALYRYDTKMSRNELNNYKQYTYIMAVNRLPINDPTGDATQPFEDPILYKMMDYPELRRRPKRMLICNGEIYNYKEIIKEENFGDQDLQSNSDVEVIMPLYIKYGLEQTLEKINGDYSFIITENLKTHNVKTTNIYVVRDRIGTKPLYRIKHNKELIYMFVTELKGIPKFILNDANYQIDEIPPGTYWSFNNTIIQNSKIEFIRYNDWNVYKSLDSCVINSTDPESIYNIYKNINKLVTDSVKSRYSCDAKIGILASGGFDSSIITSIVAKHFTDKQITVFTLNSNKYVTELIEYLEKKYSIDIIHHVIDVSSKDFENFVKNSINDIIYTLETYDATTIRNCIPYTFIYNYIKKYTDIKVLLTGEGLDELCGYTQFKDLDFETFQKKSVKLIKYLSKFDLLRSDKMAGNFGLEVRHPFLDVSFIKYILSIHPKIKSPQIYSNDSLPIEKYIIRKSFEEYLPYNLLWKRIEETSDKLNIQGIINNIASNTLELNETFNTKEKIYYKQIFDNIFGKVNGLGSINENLNKFWEDLWE